MGQADFFKKGDYNAICDSCGFKFKASQLRLRWDGLMVCQKDWNPRQPQDFVRGIADPQAPPWTRPSGDDQFIGFNYTAFPQDTLGFSENILINQSSSLSENIGFTETQVLALMVPAINESFSLSENVTISLFTVVGVDPISISEIVSTTVKPTTIAESLSLSESKVSEIDVSTITESIGISEVVSFQVIRNATAINTFAINTRAI